MIAMALYWSTQAGRLGWRRRRPPTQVELRSSDAAVTQEMQRLTDEHLAELDRRVAANRERPQP